MNNKEFTKWIEQVYATQENELNCEQTQNGLPAYVDAINQKMTIDPVVEHKISKHLNQCPDCNDIFEGLAYVTSQEIEEDIIYDKSDSITSSAVAAD